MATKKAVATRGGRNNAPQKKKSHKRAIALGVVALVCVAMVLTSTLMCLKSIGVIGGGKKVLEPKPIPVTTAAPAASSSSNTNGARLTSATAQSQARSVRTSATLHFNSNIYPFTVHYVDFDYEDTHYDTKTINSSADTLEVFEDGDDGRYISSFEWNGSQSVSDTMPKILGGYYVGEANNPTLYVDVEFYCAHGDKTVENVAATCTTPGKHYVKCNVCGNVLENTAPSALGHNPVVVEHVDATCTTTGYQVFNCSRCGVETSRDTLPALSHDLSDLVEDTEFYNIYECTSCNLHVVSFKQTPEKEGHTFCGWYYGDGDECGESCRAYVGEAFYSDTDFHAHFTINTVTVTYISDGEEFASEGIDWNTTANPLTPEKTGYNFVGWFYEDNTEYTGQEIKADTTLTAKWAIIRLTVSFYVNGVLYTTIELDYGSAMEVLDKEAEAHYLNILAVMDEDGGEVDLSEGVRTTVRVDAAKMSTLMSVATFSKLNWYWALIFFVGVVGLVACVCLALPRKVDDSGKRSTKR